MSVVHASVHVRARATLGRDDSRRWNSRTIVGAERIASPGVTPTAAAAIQAPIAVREAW